MCKKSLQHYKWIFCLFLLVWISETSIAHSRNESGEDFNDGTSAEDTQQFENNDLNGKLHALKGKLHDQLERVTHAEQINEHREEEHQNKAQLYGKPSTYRDADANDDGDGGGSDDDDENNDEEEREREYNPWQDSFQDQYEDGTYVYGYSLPNGVTRYERSFFSEKYKGRVVEGFYTQPRYSGKRTLYELRCYRSDYYSGYKALRVQYVRRPPIVRRDEEPNVDCFDKQ